MSIKGQASKNIRPYIFIDNDNKGVDNKKRDWLWHLMILTLEISIRMTFPELSIYKKIHFLIWLLME